MTVTSPYIGGNDVGGIDNGDVEFMSACSGGSRPGETDIENICEAASSTLQFCRIGVSGLTGPNGACISRVNSADGNISITITGTGTFDDNVNSDALAANDTFNLELSQPTGMHGDSITAGAPLTHLDTDRPLIGGQDSRDGALNIAGSMVFGQFCSSDFGSTVESGEQERYVAAETYDNLRVQCSQHGGQNVVFVFRDDGADGNLTVTVTGTGTFSDTTNSDSPAAGSDLNWEWDLTPEMMGNTYALNVWQVRMDRVAGHYMFREAGIGWDAAQDPVYIVPFTGGDDVQGTSTVEPSDDTNIVRNAGFQMVDMSLNVGTIGSGDTWVFTDRNEGADGNLSLTITATGDFSDTANNTDYASGDHWAIQADQTVDATTTDLGTTEEHITVEEVVADAISFDWYRQPSEPVRVQPGMVAHDV